VGGRIFLRYNGYCKNQDHEVKKGRSRTFHSSSIFSIFFPPRKKTASLALIVSFGILLWSTSSAFQKDDLFTYAQVTEVQQQEQEQQRITDNVNNSKTQIYGCAEFGESLHCDPFLNELITFRMLGNWSKISRVVDDTPRFVSIGKASTTGPPRSDSQQDTKALELNDKSREFVEIANKDAYNSPEFSVSFNIKKTTSTSIGHVLSHINKGETAGWFFDIRPESSTSSSAQNPNNIPSSHTISFGVSSNSSDVTRTNRVPVSESSPGNIVGTFNGTSVKLYKDGELFDTVEYTGKYIEDPQLPITVGSGAYCSSCARWAGVIGDIRVYDKTLSENELKSISSLPSADLGSASPSPENQSPDSNNTLSNSSLNGGGGPVGHWPFNGNLNDISGMNNHANVLTPLSSMAFTPDGRLFYNEKNTGEMRIMKDNKTLPKPFATLSDVYVDWEQGLLGVTIDPNYEKNRFVYAYYTAISEQSDSPVNRVVRFTDKNNTGTDLKVILDNIPASRGFHSGGALAFGPDDKLYITVGDATQHEYAQDPSIPIGKTLRINRDGTIPEDNPIANSPVFTLGHRNTYGIAFDWSTGTGIITENGDQIYDEVNLIQKGGNYGFPLYQPANTPAEISTSTESIKPLRSYYQTIAPTQAIYYTGDKYPYLSGKFLFGTYTGSIHALTIQNVGTNKQLLEEDHIRLGVVPFDPVNGLAQSPNGDIYFGGFNIYKLDVVGVATKRQDTFPVVLTSSPDVVLNDVQGSNDADYLFANLNINKNATTNSSQPSFVTFKIPTRFLPGISSVTYTDAEGIKSPADFAVDESNFAQTITRVQLPQNISDTQIYINGSGTRTSVRDPGSLNLYDDFENGTYRLAEGQMSPNKKWLNVDSGEGFMGVRTDLNNTNNNVFYMFPKIAKSPAETYTSLVTTTRNFSNFDMSIDVKTQNQLRQDSLPKPWETLWVFFRYTDDFHYYWFVLKPTGIELGKKDCDTCTRPFEGQVFLYTDEIPTLKPGQWSNWRINAIGNNIDVSLNGTKVIQFTDDSMSPQLASGSIGVYAEDAMIAFDNLRIEEVIPKK
jgi:glucose/arabinose dehydrogenase